MFGAIWGEQAREAPVVTVVVSPSSLSLSALSLSSSFINHPLQCQAHILRGQTAVAAHLRLRYEVPHSTARVYINFMY